MEEAFVFPGDDGGGWKCQKHPSAQPTAGGVCPVCLRDRLLRLCPGCGAGRPCACPCPSTSSASSSSSSLSSAPSADFHRCGAAGAHVGAVGRVSHLIGCEPAFRRSRSAAFRLLRPRSEDSSSGARPPQPAGGRGGWSWLWPFQRANKKADGDGAYNAAVAGAALSKSRSVGASAGASRAEARSRGWNRYLASPMKALRHHKAETCAVPSLQRKTIFRTNSRRNLVLAIANQQLRKTRYIRKSHTEKTSYNEYPSSHARAKPRNVTGKSSSAGSARPGISRHRPTWRGLNVPVCSLRGSSKSGSVFGFGQLFSSSPHKKDGTLAAVAASSSSGAARNSGSGGEGGSRSGKVVRA